MQNIHPHFKMSLKWGTLLIYIGIALIFQSNSCYAKGSRVPVASAQTLAERAGAAHYEEHYEPIESSEESSEHRLRKRASDEDFDYEVYQGVVGRPGIDFPIHARIPQTSFSCRKFGNGYFADLEAECQVFHICDGGRKISFLCPNGTIFQQPELICDWWFKVNCGKSPGFYADSAEMLSRAQNHRKNQNKRIENEFQSEGRNSYKIQNSKSSVNKNQYPIKSSRKYEESDRLNQARKSDRRIDSEESASVETVDFEDITEGTRTYHKKNDKFQSRHAEVNDGESQIVAESASFVGNNRNGYSYDLPNQESKRNSAERNYSHEESNNRAKNDRGRHKYGGYRSNVYKNGNQPKQYSNEDVAEVSTYEPLSYQSTVKPTTIQRVQARVTTVRPNTYTTARRFDVSKTTPFYTPTVPTVFGRFGEYKSTPAAPQSGKINFNIISSTQSPIVQKKMISQFQQSSRNNQAPKDYFYAKPSSFKSAPTSQPSSTANYFTPASQLPTSTKYFNAISNPTSTPNYFTPTEQPSRSTSGYFTPSAEPTSTPGYFGSSSPGYFTTSSPESSTPRYFTPSIQPSNSPKYYISDGRRPAVNFGQNIAEISTTPAFNSDYAEYSTINSGHVDFSQKLSSPTPFTLAEKTSNSNGKEVQIQIKPHKHNDAEYTKQSTVHSHLNTGSVEILGNDQTDVNIRVTTQFPVEVITGRSFTSSPQENKAKLSASNGYNYHPVAPEGISTTTSSYSTQRNDISTLSPSQLNPSELDVEIGTPNSIEAKRNIINLAKNPSVNTQSPSSFSRDPQYSTIRNIDVTTYTPQTSSSSGQTYIPNQSSTVTATYDDRAPTTYRPTATTVESSVSDHVKGMIKTLNELKVDLKVNEPSSREGLDIPPSSGPETLLSLAGYFASSEENASTTESAQTSTSDSEIEHIKPALSISNLSGKTVEKYESLFGLTPTIVPPTEPTLGPDFQPNIAPDTNDLEGQHSSGLLGGAAGKPETRKIAQVFTNALSAYLQDPTSFRRVLSEVRPTEPPVSYEAGKEFGSGTAASYLPTTATGATTKPATMRPKNGLEVLDYSDVTIAPGNEQEPTTAKSISTEITTTDEPTYGNLATSTAIPTYVDRVPASRIITENLIRQGSKLEARGPSETATDSNAVAVEINKGLGLSTVMPYLSLAESIAARKPSVNIFTSDEPLGNSRSDEFVAEWSTTLAPRHVSLSYALLPPVGKLAGSDLENNFDDDEDTLQRAQSQSFVTARNNLNKLDFQNKFKANLKLSTTASPLNNFSHAGHFITRLMSDITVTTELPESRKVTPNPWTTTSYTTYVDPLTINDELMGQKQLGTTTSSPHTYLPTSTPNPVSVEVQDADAIGSSTVHFGLIHPEIPEDILPPSNGMQRIASKMFGNLDVNSANHLMNVMKKAESNQTVRRLILLLIQTCDEDYSKTVEQSRKVLLNALIGMDQKLSGDDEVEVIKLSPKRRSKSIDASSGQANLISSTSEAPLTTAHYGLISTTTQPRDYGYSTTAQSASVEETTKFEIRVADPEEDNFGVRTSTLRPFESESSTIATTQDSTSYGTTTDAPISVTTTAEPRSSKRRTKDVSDSLGQPGLFADLSHKNSDERALDLLKSLYSLASKFSRR